MTILRRPILATMPLIAALTEDRLLDEGVKRGLEPPLRTLRR